MSKERGHFLILSRDEFRCVYCGASNTDDRAVVLTVDHIWPVNDGGSDRADNLVACCINCNSQKQDRLLSDEALARFVALAKKRNASAGIPNHQMIRLKSTGSLSRSRGEWDQLTCKFLRTAFNILIRDHEMLGAERAASISEIFCLAIEALTEYRRLTADIDRAREVASMLQEMAVEVSLVAGADLSPYKELDRTSYERDVAYHLEKLDDELLRIWLGPYGAGLLVDGFVQSGRAKISEIEIVGERITSIPDDAAELYIRSWQEGREEMRQFWKGRTRQALKEQKP
jgi:hypothetical protein